MSAVKMASNSKRPDWPVILHQSLERSDYVVLFKQKQLKLRFSESVVTGSIIFPLSGVAFCAVPLSKTVTTNTNNDSQQITDEFKERLDSLLQVHRTCFLLCLAPFHGLKEQQIFSLIQTMYLHTHLAMIPVHSVNEAVKTMLTIAMPLCKPANKLMSSKLQSMLQQQLTVDHMAAAMKQLGLTEHQIQVVEDGLGNLERLVTASREELLDCSLESQTVDKLLNFFAP